MNPISAATTPDSASVAVMAMTLKDAGNNAQLLEKMLPATPAQEPVAPPAVASPSPYAVDVRA